MLNKKMPPWMFNLEGTFLGFIGTESDQTKSIGLEVEQEQIAIKLPKKLRASVQQNLQPGDRICCIGRSRVDFETGVIKLDASHLFSVVSTPQDPPVSSSFPLPVAPTLPPAHASTLPPVHAKPKCSTLSPGQKCAKILVCRKPGCQKRGGQQLVAELERVLQERQLQEQVKIQYTRCQKRCSKAPNLTIMPGKHQYDRLNFESLPALVEEHFCTP